MLDVLQVSEYASGYSFCIHTRVNLLTANAPHYIETSQLIYNPNQLTGFYMMGNVVQ